MSRESRTFCVDTLPVQEYKCVAFFITFSFAPDEDGSILS